MPCLKRSWYRSIVVGALALGCFCFPGFSPSVSMSSQHPPPESYFSSSDPHPEKRFGRRQGTCFDQGRKTLCWTLRQEWTPAKKDVRTFPHLDDRWCARAQTRLDASTGFRTLCQSTLHAAILSGIYTGTPSATFYCWDMTSLAKICFSLYFVIFWPFMKQQ